MKRIAFLVAFLVRSFCMTFAQTTSDTTATAEESPLKISGFVDTYYAYDFNEPADKNRPSFLYSHNRHNEFAINDAILSATYNQERVRGAFSLVTGTYARSNYAAEPTLFQFIYEAYAGYQLAEGLWLDAGIFSSHIGSESAISIDNLTLTRSLMAENTPYFETGVKLTYEAGDKLTLTGLVLNGWQNIVETNDNKAFGTQIQYRPTDGILLNSSSFVGKEKPAYFSPTNPEDPLLSSWRLFHNLYGQFEMGEQVTIMAALDIGAQEKLIGDGYDVWYSPNLIVKYAPNGKFAVAGRAEYYSDEAGAIIATGTENGFQTFGYSLTLDYRPVENVAIRLEGRGFNSQDAIFSNADGEPSSNNGFVISSVAFKF